MKFRFRYRGTLSDISKIGAFENRALALAKVKGMAVELAAQAPGVPGGGVRSAVLWPSESYGAVRLVVAHDGRLLPVVPVAASATDGEQVLPLRSETGEEDDETKPPWIEMNVSIDEVNAHLGTA